MTRELIRQLTVFWAIISIAGALAYLAAAAYFRRIEGKEAGLIMLVFLGAAIFDLALALTLAFRPSVPVSVIRLTGLICKVVPITWLVVHLYRYRKPSKSSNATNGTPRN